MMFKSNIPQGEKKKKQGYVYQKLLRTGEITAEIHLQAHRAQVRFLLLLSCWIASLWNTWAQTLCSCKIKAYESLDICGKKLLSFHVIAMISRDTCNDLSNDIVSIECSITVLLLEGLFFYFQITDILFFSPSKIENKYVSIKYDRTIELKVAQGI